jgi:hypothetical protein
LVNEKAGGERFLVATGSFPFPSHLPLFSLSLLSSACPPLCTTNERKR